MKVETQETGKSDATAKLLVVQGYDMQLRDLEREMNDIPLRKKEEEDRLTEHKEALVAAETKQKASQLAIKELEAESVSREEKITKLRQQQMQLKTNKEFQAMEAEIAAVQGEISGIEDRELGLMEEVEAARKEMDQKKQALAEEEAAVAGDCKAWDERMGELESETERIRAQRAEAAQGVGDAWMVKYETTLERKAPAVAIIEDGICGGCHMKLPPYVIHDARRGDAMVLCDYCGRLLHWPG